MAEGPSLNGADAIRKITIGSDAGGLGEEQAAWIDEIVVR